MSNVNQKTGVFEAICTVTEQDSFDGACVLTKEELAQVYEIVTDRFMSNEIEMTDKARLKYCDRETMRARYVPGLVRNWITKDLRLNGNKPHQTLNPGSRAGSSDAVIRELKKLMSTFTEQNQVDAVQTEIDKRLALLKAEKAKSVEIDMSLIPDDLKDLLG